MAREPWLPPPNVGLRPTWITLHAARPDGHSTKPPQPGTVGEGRSRLGTSRGGPRPLEAAAPATITLATAVRHDASRIEAHHRGAGEYDDVGLCERASSRR